MKDDVNDDDDDDYDDDGDDNDDDNDDNVDSITVLRGRSEEVACGVEFEWTTRLFWS